jgi:putative tryptophan/tyrosine transport system substrate-binding protein
MERRTFLGVLAGSLLAAPLAAEAQEPSRVHKVGYLWRSSAVPMQRSMAAFRQQLRDLGWVEGRNIRLESYSLPPYAS